MEITNSIAYSTVAQRILNKFSIHSTENLIAIKELLENDNVKPLCNYIERKLQDNVLRGDLKLQMSCLEKFFSDYV